MKRRKSIFWIFWVRLMITAIVGAFLWVLVNCSFAISINYNERVEVKTLGDKVWTGLEKGAKVVKVFF